VLPILLIASEDNIMLIILAHNIIHEFVVALLLVRLVWHPLPALFLAHNVVVAML